MEKFNTYVKYTQDDEITTKHYFNEDPSLENKIFRFAANLICFSDCGNTSVEEIVIRGKHYEYAGWQPDMLFEFIDSETKEVVWTRYFPQWEH